MMLRSIQIVSFWFCQKGMRGVGGRRNALRHRHDRSRSPARIGTSVCARIGAGAVLALSPLCLAKNKKEAAGWP